MFTTIANFLFGASKPDLNDIQNTEYRTREEEDEWLLVNVSGQDNDDDDDEENAQEDTIDDEVLESIPLLFTPEIPSPQNSLQVSRCDNSVVLSPPARTISRSKFFIDRYNLMAFMPTVFVPSCWMTPGCLQGQPSNWLTLMGPDVEKSFAYLEFENDRHSPSPLPVSVVADVQVKTENIAQQQHKPYSFQTRHEKLDECQTTAYIVGPDPSPSTVISKTELLQQIKELRPIQQAKEYELRKHLNKSQLNRHNKAYMYTTSNKNQHRRDLWVRHSGVNNNRKCC